MLEAIASSLGLQASAISSRMWARRATGARALAAQNGSAAALVIDMEELMVYLTIVRTALFAVVPKQVLRSLHAVRKRDS